jgi:branched-chain amino acid transport system substrate-binding protein
VLYNRGVYNSLLIAEAIANAQKITGKKVVTGEDVRRGLESINITPERLKELGLEGFAEPLKLTCTDHNGHKAAFLQEWDGEKWVRTTDLIEPLHDRVSPLLKAAAQEYATKNTGWAKRTETCDAPA